MVVFFAAGLAGVCSLGTTPTMMMVKKMARGERDVGDRTMTAVWTSGGGREGGVACCR